MDKLDKLISSLTLEEKIGQLTQISSINFFDDIDHRDFLIFVQEEEILITLVD